jgi:peptidoglycan hydrolase-like protein with peptidoglycan-binding domain
VTSTARPSRSPSQARRRDLGRYDLGSFGPAKDGVDGKYGDKTRAAVKQFKADESLGNPTSGNTDHGVIYRLDDLFPPVAVPVTTP